MIEVRRLAQEEYPLLKSFSDGFCPDPQRSIAIVADNGEHIVGRIFLIAPAHVEAIHIERPWRNGLVMKRLVDFVELEARAEGIAKVLAYAKDKEMENYIERLGYKKIQVTVWSKELS